MLMTKQGFAVLLTAVCCAFGAREASAQQRDVAGAQALFEQARALSQSGRYAEACPKFLESNRLDPGIGTQFHLADCYEQSGQIASAWATFLDVASLARASGQVDREKAATKRAARLEPRLPKLTVTVPEASQVTGLEIRRDGILVGPAQWGAPIPGDPGDHQLSVTAPGLKGIEQPIKLEEGKALNFEVPLLEREEAVAEAAPVALAPPEPPPKPPLSVASPRQDAPEQPPVPAPVTSKVGGSIWPLAFAGVGVVAIGTGVGFAVRANSINNQSRQDCDALNVCGPTGYAFRNDALKAGTTATVAFLAGGAFLIVGGVVWDLEYRARKSAASSPSPLRASVVAAPGHASLYVKGDF